MLSLWYCCLQTTRPVFFWRSASKNTSRVKEWNLLAQSKDMLLSALFGLIEVEAQNYSSTVIRLFKLGHRASVQERTMRYYVTSCRRHALTGIELALRVAWFSVYKAGTQCGTFWCIQIWHSAWQALTGIELALRVACSGVCRAGTHCGSQVTEGTVYGPSLLWDERQMHL